MDPELARRARAQLPDVRPADLAAAPTPKAPPAPAPAPQPARRWLLSPARALAAALLLSLAGSAAAVALAWTTGSDGRGLSAAGAGRAGHAPPSSATDRAAGPPAAHARRSTAAPAEVSRQGGATTPNPRRSPRPTLAATAPAQTFVWLPAQGATRYQVEFFRDGRRVFLGFTSRPRLVTPGSWLYRGRMMRFHAGLYLWTVRPRFGPRYGRPIVRSEWTFTG